VKLNALAAIAIAAPSLQALSPSPMATRSSRAASPIACGASTQSTSLSVTPLQSTGSRVVAVAHTSITQAVSCRGARSMAGVRLCPCNFLRHAAFMGQALMARGDRAPAKHARCVRAGEVPLSYNAISDEIGVPL
jgi:hypothetical protein